jgi:signal transduction histidine kinase
MNKKCLPAIRVAALFVCLCLGLETPGYSAVSGNTQSSRPIRLNDSVRGQFPLIAIPESLGKVEDYYQGESGKTILYIQDAHDSLEAQEHIAGIIAYLVGHHGVKTVYEEGYEGPVPSDRYFGSIRDAEVKQKLSWFFMDRLRLGGAEYAHINRKQDFDLIGVEDLQLYEKNLQTFKQAVLSQNRILGELKAMRFELRKLIDRSLPKDVKTWMNEKAQFSDGKLGFLDYAARLLQKVPSRQKETATKYPLLATLTAEPSKLPQDTLQKIAQMPAQKIFGELEMLEHDFVEARLKDPKERQLLQYEEGLVLLERLVRMSVAPREYEAARSKLKELRTDEMADFIARESGKPVLLSKRWERAIAKCLRFYEVVSFRDRSFEKNFGQYFGSKEPQTAVLVFGGFHKEPIQEYFRSRGYSYITITPAITAESKKHKDYYQRLMGAGHHDFEAPLLARTGLKEQTLYQVSGYSPELIAAAAAEVRRLGNLDQAIIDRVLERSAVWQGKRSESDGTGQASDRPAAADTVTVAPEGLKVRSDAPVSDQPIAKIKLPGRWFSAFGLFRPFLELCVWGLFLPVVVATRRVWDFSAKEFLACSSTPETVSAVLFCQKFRMRAQSASALSIGTARPEARNRESRLMDGGADAALLDQKGINPEPEKRNIPVPHARSETRTISALFENSWMKRLYTKEQIRDMETSLSPGDDPLKNEAWLAVRDIPDSDVIAATDAARKQDPVSHAMPEGAEIDALTFRELFIQPSDDLIDLATDLNRRIVRIDDSFITELISAGRRDAAVARYMLVFLYFRSIAQLPKDPTPLIRAADVPRIIAYLNRIAQQCDASLARSRHLTANNRNTVGIQKRRFWLSHWLAYRDELIPADTDEKRESLRNLLSVFDQLTGSNTLQSSTPRSDQGGRLWRAAISEEGIWQQAVQPIQRALWTGGDQHRQRSEARESAETEDSIIFQSIYRRNFQIEASGPEELMTKLALLKDPADLRTEPVIATQADFEDDGIITKKVIDFLGIDADRKPAKARLKRGTGKTVFDIRWKISRTIPNDRDAPQRLIELLNAIEMDGADSSPRKIFGLKIAANSVQSPGVQELIRLVNQPYQFSKLMPDGDKRKIVLKGLLSLPACAMQITPAAIGIRPEWIAFIKKEKWRVSVAALTEYANTSRPFVDDWIAEFNIALQDAAAAKEAEVSLPGLAFDLIFEHIPFVPSPYMIRRIRQAIKERIGGPRVSDAEGWEKTLAALTEIVPDRLKLFTIGITQQMEEDFERAVAAAIPGRKQGLDSVAGLDDLMDNPSIFDNADPKLKTSILCTLVYMVPNLVPVRYLGLRPETIQALAEIKEPGIALHGVRNVSELIALWQSTKDTPVWPLEEVEPDSFISPTLAATPFYRLRKMARLDIEHALLIVGDRETLTWKSLVFPAWELVKYGGTYDNIAQVLGSRHARIEMRVLAAEKKFIKTMRHNRKRFYELLMLLHSEVKPSWLYQDALHHDHNAFDFQEGHPDSHAVENWSREEFLNKRQYLAEIIAHRLATGLLRYTSNKIRRKIRHAVRMLKLPVEFPKAGKTGALSKKYLDNRTGHAVQLPKVTDVLKTALSFHQISLYDLSKDLYILNVEADEDRRGFHVSVDDLLGPDGGESIVANWLFKISDSGNLILDNGSFLPEKQGLLLGQFLNLLSNKINLQTPVRLIVDVNEPGTLVELFRSFQPIPSAEAAEGEGDAFAELEARYAALDTQPDTELVSDMKSFLTERHEEASEETERPSISSRKIAGTWIGKLMSNFGNELELAIINEEHDDHPYVTITANQINASKIRHQIKNYMTKIATVADTIAHELGKSAEDLGPFFVYTQQLLQDFEINREEPARLPVIRQVCRDIYRDFDYSAINSQLMAVERLIAGLEHAQAETLKKFLNIMRVTIKYLHAYAGIVLGEEEDTVHDFKLDSVAEAMLSLGEVSRSNVRIICKFPEQGVKVHLPEILISEILLNLIKNAVEACKDVQGRSAEVIVEIKEHKEEVSITISDNGTGMSKEQIKMVMDAFSFTTKTTGSGIGLPITVRQIASLGGHLEIGSKLENRDKHEPGQTSIKVFLPKSVAKDYAVRNEIRSTSYKNEAKAVRPAGNDLMRIRRRLETSKAVIDFRDFCKYFPDSQKKEILFLAQNPALRGWLLIRNVDRTDVFGQFLIAQAPRLPGLALGFETDESFLSLHLQGFSGQVLYLSSEAAQTRAGAREINTMLPEGTPLLLLSHRGKKGGALAEGLLRSAELLKRQYDPAEVGTDEQGRFYFRAGADARLNQWEQLYDRSIAFASAA